MAQENQTPNAQQPNAPQFLAWHVTQKGKNSYWNKVSAVWAHKDQRGYTLQLEPINGRVVLRQPIEDPAEPAITEERS